MVPYGTVRYIYYSSKGYTIVYHLFIIWGYLSLVKCKLFTLPQVTGSDFFFSHTGSLSDCWPAGTVAPLLSTAAARYYCSGSTAYIVSLISELEATRTPVSIA